jgi:CDP-glycerol glycerophosphotransferase
MHVVYNSFLGRYSDSPRAIFECLRERNDLHHTWLQDPGHAAAFPEGVDVVSVSDPGVRDVLESADLLVANTHTEFDWDKPAGTTYLQTWHGTPLKRIHYDVLLVPPGRLDYLDEDVARWDVLLSPNAVSTPRLRKAFGYDGPVWETGYPRNDLLVGPLADSVRSQVRAELGIDEDETAVLYAPTWRDDEKYREDVPDIPLRLQLGALVERLDAAGSDVPDRNGSTPRHRLLARTHNMVSDRSRAEVAPGVLDVSYFRDVRDLYLAADVLVTDYSSVMFDFALTGKPMVFYAYDLDRYRDEIRGFYFDLFPDAPGPVATTEDELVDELVSLEANQDRYAARYRAFRHTYGHLEDGHATDRVLQRLRLA